MTPAEVREKRRSQARRAGLWDPNAALVLARQRPFGPLAMKCAECGQGRMSRVHKRHVRAMNAAAYV